MPEHQTGTREHILNVALHLFATRGYWSTSMDEIAKEVGVSKPAIYHYFTGKEALLLALIRLLEQKHYQWFEELRENKKSLPLLLETTIYQRLLTFQQNPDWILMMIRLHTHGLLGDLSEFDEIKEIDRSIHRAEERLIADSLAGFRFRPGLNTQTFVEFYHDVVFSFVGRCVMYNWEINQELESKRLSDLIMFGTCEKA